MIKDYDINNNRKNDILIIINFNYEVNNKFIKIHNHYD